jgi:hypothetical protein
VCELNKLSVIDWIALVLVIVGGLNWGLSLWDINLVTMIFGGIASWVYALVGLSGLYMIWLATGLTKK